MKSEITPKFKMWLSTKDAEGVFGDGKWRLLKAVEEKGSLKAASDYLGISYRKAWGDLKKAEACLGIKFIEKIRGGQHGGSTVLTPEGLRWIKAYGRFRREIENKVDKSFVKLEKTLFHENNI